MSKPVAKLLLRLQGRIPPFLAGQPNPDDLCRKHISEVLLKNGYSTSQARDLVDLYPLATRTGADGATFQVQTPCFTHYVSFLNHLEVINRFNEDKRCQLDRIVVGIHTPKAPDMLNLLRAFVRFQEHFEPASANAMVRNRLSNDVPYAYSKSWLTERGFSSEYQWTTLRYLTQEPQGRGRNIYLRTVSREGWFFLLPLNADPRNTIQIEAAVRRSFLLASCQHVDMRDDLEKLAGFKTALDYAVEFTGTDFLGFDPAKQYGKRNARRGRADVVSIDKSNTANSPAELNRPDFRK